MDTASIFTVVAAVGVMVEARKEVRREGNSETTHRLSSKFAVWN